MTLYIDHIVRIKHIWQGLIQYQYITELLPFYAFDQAERDIELITCLVNGSNALL